MSNRSIARNPQVEQALLYSTGVLLQQFGYRKVSMEEIAQSAGLSRATAYLYYPNKQALALAWLERRGEERLQQMRELAARPGDPETVLRQLLLGRVYLSLDKLNNWGEHLDELLEALRGPMAAWRKQLLDSEVELVAAALRACGYREKPEENARTLCLACHGLLPTPERWGADPGRVRAQVEQLVEWLLRGLAATQP